MIELLSLSFSDEVLETSNTRNQNQAWLLSYSYSDKISEPSNSWNQNLAYWIRVMELKNCYSQLLKRCAGEGLTAA